MREIVAEALTREAFAPFGDVIEVGGAATRYLINGGNTERFHDLAELDPGQEGRIIVSIFRGQPRQMPFTVTMMERHPFGSQAFMPLSGRPYLVVVAAATPDAPDAGDLRAFLARPDQGVNYAPGVWHHPLLALDAVCDFLILDRAGPNPNCDEIELASAARVSV